MEHSIKHNLNKCQLGPCFEAPILKHPNVYRDVAGKGDQSFFSQSSPGLGLQGQRVYLRHQRATLSGDKVQEPGRQFSPGPG